METLPGDPTDFFQVLEKLGEGSYGEGQSVLLPILYEAS